MKKIIKIGSSFIVALIICAVVAGFIVSKKENSSNLSSIQYPIWGSSSTSFPGEKGVSGVEAWKRLNDKIKSLNGGYGLQARRSYDRAIPASFVASAMGPDIDLCPVSVGSFKPSWQETANGSNNEAIKKFIQSIPDNHEVYLVFHHEPEDEAAAGSGGRNPELLKAAFAKFVEVVLNAGKPNVHPCFVLMSWTFNPKSGRNPDDFNLGAKLKPEQISKVVAGLDGYAALPTTASGKSIFAANFAKMASWGFKRFGIFETGTHSDDTKTGRADWIKAFGQWINSRKDIELVCWFHSGVGQHAGPKGWYLGQWTLNADGSFNFADNDGSIAAYSQLLRPKL